MDASTTQSTPGSAVAGDAWLAKLRLEPFLRLRPADHLVIALAVSLPWSTSATSLLVLLWLIALIPTLDIAALRRELLTPAGGLPVLLWLLAVLGMLWADVTWAERLYGLRPYHKLLAIPLLLVQFRRSEAGWYALAAFVASCAALLTFSWLQVFWRALHWDPQRPLGVPIKDRLVQSTEFMICGAALIHPAIDALLSRRRLLAGALAVLAVAFLANTLYVVAARTALIVTPCLLVLVGFQRFGPRGAIGLLGAGAVLILAVWTTSPILGARVVSAFHEVGEFRANNPMTNAGLRLEYWRQSLGFLEEAPLLGHGTGSARSLSMEAVRDEGVTQRAAMPNNPHNQTLAVGVQLGMLGMTLLFAMWLSHLALFRGAGLAAWIGMIVMIQNVVSSLFNSHLFDFTQGWIYVFGVGILAGLVCVHRHNRGG
jgi:O-antigen ligase